MDARWRASGLHHSNGVVASLQLTESAEGQLGEHHLTTVLRSTRLTGHDETVTTCP
jgi:hypothetical protein